MRCRFQRSTCPIGTFQANTQIPLWAAFRVVWLYESFVNARPTGSLLV